MSVSKVKSCKTFYFAGLKEKGIKPDDCISICRFPPDWWLGASARLLAPSEELLKAHKLGVISESSFETEYLAELNATVATEKRKEQLANFVNGKVLLCYEKSGDFCHRHILGKWLEKNCGLAISEV